MGYFPVRYISRVIIYEHKMVIRLATGRTFLISTYLLSLSLSFSLASLRPNTSNTNNKQGKWIFLLEIPKGYIYYVSTEQRCLQQQMWPNDH